MTITTVRPDATIFKHADITVTGAANAHTALSDNTDASYIGLSVDSSITKTVTLSIADIVLAGGSVIKQVRTRVRYVNLNAGSQTGITLTFQDSAVANLWASGTFLDTDTALEYIGPWRTVWPRTSGTSWTEAEVNDLQITLGLFTDKPNLFRDIRIYELYVDVETNALPTATVTAPSGNVTSTTRPIITTTYADADNDLMDRYEVKVFDAATYGAGGFSPDTSTPTWTSGEVSFSASAGIPFNVSIIGTDLVNGVTYRAYARCRQVPDSQWSAWSNSTFTLVLDTPAQPVLVGTLDNANGRIQLSVLGRDNFVTKNRASFESSVDWVAGSNTVLARVTTQFLHGIAAMSMGRLVSTGTADAISGNATVYSVAVGSQYTALASFKAAATATARNCTVAINWFTAASAPISTSTSSSVADSTGGWTQVAVTAVAPATAAFANITLSIAAVPLGESHFVDQVSFAPGASTVWTRGGYIAAGLYRMIVERTLDGGATWNTFIGSSFVPPLTTLATTIYDYTVPLNTPVSYRAKAFGVDVLEIGGPPSATAGPFTSAPTTATGWYIKDPLDPTVNQVLAVDMDSWDTKIKEEQASYSALGRQFPIVISDVIRGIEGVLKAAFTSKVAYDAFVVLRNKQHTLLLQRVYKNEEWYIRLGPEMATNEQVGDYYVVTISFKQVDAPVAT